jgi:IMP dehydrogenase/GMP reductase
MLNTRQEKLHLNDVCIVPATITSIESRSECSVKYENRTVNTPLFASPMCCVTDANNYNTWVENGIQAIMPRTVPWETRCWAAEIGRWVAMSQKEFEYYFVKESAVLRGPGQTYYICIDTANAHRESIYKMVRTAKEIGQGEYSIVVMVGNIGNPDTYRWICEYYSDCVDFVRLCIGSGDACITTTQTSVHYPEASLIHECADIRTTFTRKTPYIVADGGIRCNAHIYTALALGADYVMMGSLLASKDESSAQLHQDIETNKQKKIYFGMSTKKAQKLINAASYKPVPEHELKLKTSEGTFKYLEPTGSIVKWIENFNDYLRSTMSYTNCRTLEQFTSGSVQLVRKSAATTSAINK